MGTREGDYWEGYRASMMDLRVTLTGGKAAGWTMTSDVEALIGLIDARLDAMPQGDDEIPFSDEPRFRATDPHGGHGPNGKGFATATSYTAIAIDGEVMLVKAGLPGDSFKPDDAAGFAAHLQRVAARARLPLEVQS